MTPAKRSFVQRFPKAGEYGFFSKGLVNTNQITQLMLQHQLRYGVAMTEKYVSTGVELVNGSLQTLFNQTKPKNLTRDLFSLAEN